MQLFKVGQNYYNPASIREVYVKSAQPPVVAVAFNGGGTTLTLTGDAASEVLAQIETNVPLPSVPAPLPAPKSVKSETKAA